MTYDILKYLIITSGIITFLMIVANPFFENKKLLKITLIPAIITWALGLVMVALK